MLTQNQGEEDKLFQLELCHVYVMVLVFCQGTEPDKVVLPYHAYSSITLYSLVPQQEYKHFAIHLTQPGISFDFM